MKKIWRRFRHSCINLALILVMVCVACNAAYQTNQSYQTVKESSYEDSKVVIPTITSKAHIQKIGWKSVKKNVIGTVGKSLRLEAFSLKLSGVKNLGIKYRAYVQGSGWQSYVSDGETAGTEGKSKRLEAVQIELTGENADKYDVYYRANVQGFGWMKWTKNGDSAGTLGYGKRIEAIQVKIVKKDSSFDTGSGSSYKKKNTISMQAHVQSYGWMSSVYSGEVLGVTGQSKRLEAIKLTPVGYKFNIEYSVHVQKTGWTSYVKNGATAGTTGKSLRLEAVKIKLSGTDSSKYDVYYRVHVQGIGWMDWAKNGEAAGTTGGSLRMEALDVRIVKKGAAAPGSTTTPYKEYSGTTKAQKYARAKLNQIGWDLRSAFNYAASLTYYRSVAVPASGNHLEGYAAYGFETGKGNCYVMAAVFCRMARELGYECYLVEGYVPKIGGGTTVHGWAEIVVNGRTYVCDPDFTHETGKNGYMITYGTSGTWVYQSYSRVN